MRLRLEELVSKLSKPLLPVYVLAGPEPLLLQEAGDAIRAAARGRGYEERERFDVDAGFDWFRLDQAGANLSLFSRRRLIEVNLDSGKPGREGSAALIRYAKRPPEDTILLLRCGQLDKSGRGSAWLRALEAAGAMIQVWRVERGRMPGWLQQRMRAVGLKPDREATLLLSERVEGNLLAAAQEIEKLRILNGAGPVNAGEVRRVVGDSARYDVFELVDAALSRDVGRVVRVSQGLREEGVEPTLVCWALTREVRSLYRLRRAADSSSSAEAAMTKAGVHRRRVDLVRQALNRMPLSELSAMLGACALCERVIKGQMAGAPWDELVHLGLRLAGFGNLCAARSGNIP